MDYIKRCKPKSCRQAKRDDDMDEWVALKAMTARTYAESLTYQGMDPGEVCNMADRSAILKSESD